MQLTLLPRENGVIIRVEEKRLDAAVATAFKDRVRNLVAHAGPCVTLDLGPVDFMDSSGLGAVIAIYGTLVTSAIAMLLPAIGVAPPPPSVQSLKASAKVCVVPSIYVIVAVPLCAP